MNQKVRACACTATQSISRRFGQRNSQIASSSCLLRLGSPSFAQVLGIFFLDWETAQDVSNLDIIRKLWPTFLSCKTSYSIQLLYFCIYVFQMCLHKVIHKHHQEYGTRWKRVEPRLQHDYSQGYLFISNLVPYLLVELKTLNILKHLIFVSKY